MKPIFYIAALIALVVASCKQPNQDKLDALVERGNFQKSELCRCNQIQSWRLDVHERVSVYGYTYTLLSSKTNTNLFGPCIWWTIVWLNLCLIASFLSREEGFNPAYYKLDSIKSMLQRLESWRNKFALRRIGTFGVIGFG